jgi:rhamnulokinase
MELLAFDYGASGGKAVAGIYDGKKLRLEEIHRFANEPVMLGNGFYWDVLRLFHEMKKGILKYKLKNKSKIAGIGVDTWGVDFALIDKNGNLIRNPFHYRDRRTEKIIDAVKKKIELRKIYDETGIQIQKFNTLYQLFAMKKKDPACFDNVDKLLFMPDFFNYLLSGEKVCEFTIASTSQMFNMTKNQWSEGILKTLEIPIKMLIDVTCPCHVIGRTGEWLNDELNIGKTPVISIAGHDTGSAVAAVPVSEEYYAYLSSGTWSLLGIESLSPIINDMSFKLNYTNEGGVGKTFRVLKNIMGLWILQECMREWSKNGEDISYERAIDLAWKSPGFVSFIDPDDGVFYSPGNMIEKIDAFCRVTEQKIPSGKGEIVRCILESLALKYKLVMDELEMIIGHELSVIHVVGGGCNNRLLCQFTANATGKTVVAGPVEATVVGNLICQLIGLGEIGNLEEGRALVRSSFENDIYQPENRELWHDAFYRFEKLLNRVEGEFYV